MHEHAATIAEVAALLLAAYLVSLLVAYLGVSRFLKDTA